MKVIRDFRNRGNHMSGKRVMKISKLGKEALWKKYLERLIVE